MHHENQKYVLEEKEEPEYKKYVIKEKEDFNSLLKSYKGYTEKEWLFVSKIGLVRSKIYKILVIRS